MAEQDITNRGGTGDTGAPAQLTAEEMAQNLADRREENALMYQRANPTASKKQVSMMLKLVKGGYLAEVDFGSPADYRNKKNMSVKRASELIKLGLGRQKEFLMQRKIEQLRRGT